MQRTTAESYRRSTKPGRWPMKEGALLMRLADAECSKQKPTAAQQEMSMKRGVDSCLYGGGSRRADDKLTNDRGGYIS
jgi:hypothetical protein